MGRPTFWSLAAACCFGSLPAFSEVPLRWQWAPGYEPSPIAPKTVSAALPRSNADRPDDAAGPQVHLMYVLPSDGVDESVDTNGRIGTSALAFNRWLLDQTPGRAFRIDTYQGLPDISF